MCFCLTEMHINEIVLVFEVWSPDIFVRWWWCLTWLGACTSGTLLVQLFLLLQCHEAVTLWIVWFVSGRLAAAVIAHILFTLNHCAVVNCWFLRFGIYQIIKLCPNINVRFAFGLWILYSLTKVFSYWLAIGGFFGDSIV